MIYVVATLELKPDSTDAAVEAATPCVLETRKEEGCISYDLNRDALDETKLVFVERWTGMDALKAHFNTPHMAAWREKAADLVAKSTIEIIDPADVKTL